MSVTTYRSLYNIQKEIDALCSRYFRDENLTDNEKKDIQKQVSKKKTEYKKLELEINKLKLL